MLKSCDGLKKLFKVLISILLLVLGFVSGKGYLLYKGYRESKKVQPCKSYPVVENKPFVVVIPSYNNEKWCDKNLSSVLEQSYPNFRVIFINDASADNTLQIAQKYKKISQVNFTIVDNPVNLGALQNIYNAVHTCQNDEIVVLVDGDDWLSHENVLDRLNQAYANPDIWMTYGQYVTYPAYKKGHCRKVEKKIFREHDWIFSHVKTFQAGLFKRIQKNDLLDEGKFFSMASDLAFMIPMLEMASKGHIYFIEDVLYIYNRVNPINDDKLNRKHQLLCESMIRGKKAYKAL
ncbi:MAG: hypothetical protein COT84_01855 [Chlamydiae bacterium CG10_big_fil_rev_8_21_14_0_10_35_9]|nr:MAG: hypothetical protein COT84_01855 [Chlamydiae bacterium CG10_big_fil_rev_8_21_14_0_10_35_9]